MADIKKLLNKKGWTGRELGIIELTNMSELYRQGLEGNPDPKPLIDPAQFQKMINGIVERSQGMIYNGYISIHEWIQVQLNVALSQEQQLQLQFKTLMDYVTNAMTAENAYKYVEQLPAIMTQREYDEKKAAAIEAQLVDEDGLDLTWDIYQMVEQAISYFMDELEKHPKKPNPLKPVKKKYERELVQSEHILSRWNKATGAGYYTLEDGRRSDEMTAEEWQAALTTPKMKRVLANVREMGIVGQAEAEDIALKKYTARANIIMAGGTDADADKELSRMDYEDGLAVPAEWHFYEDPPHDLTKWQVVEAGLYEFYPDYDHGEEALTASVEDFYREFEELANAIIAEIDKGEWVADKIKDFPAHEWTGYFIPIRTLYEGGYYGMEDLIEGHYSIWGGNKRALWNGIAIFSPSPAWIETMERYGTDEEHRRYYAKLDERGYYVPPDIQSSLYDLSLEAFFTDGEGYAHNVGIVENGRQTLLDSYYYIKGYNMALDMIAAYYDVPAVEVFKIHIDYLERKMDAFNDLVPALFYKIYGTDYEDEELKQRKLQVIRDIFYPLDYKSLTIPEERIEEVKESFKDFHAFKERYGIIAEKLCTRPADDEDGEGACEC